MKPFIICFAFFFIPFKTSIIFAQQWSIEGNVFIYGTVATPISSASVTPKMLIDGFVIVRKSSDVNGHFSFEIDKKKMGLDYIKVSVTKQHFIQVDTPVIRKVNESYIELRMKMINGNKNKHQTIISQIVSKGADTIKQQQINTVKNAEEISQRNKDQTATSINATELINNKLNYFNKISENLDSAKFDANVELLSLSMLNNILHNIEGGDTTYSAYDLYILGLKARMIDENRIAEKYFEYALLSYKLNKFIEADINIVLTETRLKLGKMQNSEQHDVIRQKMKPSYLEKYSIDYIFHYPYFEILQGQIKSRNKEISDKYQSIIERENSALHYFDIANRDLDQAYTRNLINQRSYPWQYVQYHQLKHLIGYEKAVSSYRLWMNEKLFKIFSKRNGIQENKKSYKKYLLKAYPPNSAYLALLMTRHAELFRKFNKYRKAKRLYIASNNIINKIYDDGISVDKINNYIGLGFVNRQLGDTLEAFQNMTDAEILVGAFFEEYDPTTPQIYYWRAVSYQSELKYQNDINDSDKYYKAKANYNYSIETIDNCIKRTTDEEYKERLRQIKAKIVLAKANFLKTEFTFLLMGQKVLDSLMNEDKKKVQIISKNENQVEQFRKSFKNGKKKIDFDKEWKEGRLFRATSLHDSYFNNIVEIENLLLPFLNASEWKITTFNDSILYSEIIIQYLWAKFFDEWLRDTKIKSADLLENIILPRNAPLKLLNMEKLLKEIYYDSKIRKQNISTKYINKFFIPNNELPVNAIGDFEY